MDSPASKPSLSVTIASWSGEETLMRCLDSVLPQLESAEVIVAVRGVIDPAVTLTRRYPKVRFLRGPEDASVFLLRSLALKDATGQVVAMLEDHAMVRPGWATALYRANAKGWRIFGGPIDNDEPASPYNWALYLVEYGIYMPPMPGGESNILSGVNIAYDRDLLQKCRAIWEQVFYETDVNAALVREGHKLYMLPDARVCSRLRMTFGEAMEHLYTGGKHFGGFRSLHSSGGVRWLWVLASPLVPFVLLLRILRLTLSRRPGKAFSVLCGLPPLLLLLGAWSAGEAVSYSRGASGGAKG